MKPILTACLFLLIIRLYAQSPARPPEPSRYDQHKAFAPQFYSSGSTLYRGAGGSPGLRYWINRADYLLVTTMKLAYRDMSLGISS